jgi:hypothetical protein
MTGTPGDTTLYAPNAPNNDGDNSTAANSWVRNRRVMNSTSSWHPGGVNALFGYGSVHFANETIETGSGTKIVLSVESPFGVWGALGSIAGGDNGSL